MPPSDAGVGETKRWRDFDGDPSASVLSKTSNFQTPRNAGHVAHRPSIFRKHWFVFVATHLPHVTRTYWDT